MFPNQVIKCILRWGASSKICIFFFQKLFMRNINVENTDGLMQEFYLKHVAW